MSEIFTGRIDRLEIGLTALNNVDMTKVILMNWERNHDVRPRLFANAKTPTTYNQPHSWIVGSFSLLSDNHAAIYATDVSAVPGNQFALIPNADSNVIDFFQVTYRDSNNNLITTRFYFAIITRGVKELLNYDDSVWIYHFLAGYAVDEELEEEELLMSENSDDSLFWFDGITETITTSFSFPGTAPKGLTLDSLGNLISADSGTDSIYIHEGITSTITTSFSHPESVVQGLTLDASQNLIVAGDVDQSIFIHDGITSTITTSFSSPDSQPMGLTMDGSGNLVSSDAGTTSIFIHSGITDTITTSFSHPDGDPQGLTLDRDGNLIVAGDSDNTIYIHSGITVTITTSFSASTTQPRGLTLTS